MRNSLVIGLLFTSLGLHAGDSLVMQLNVRSTFFTTDQYLNIYFISAANEIVKYNLTTKDSITYSNKQLGTPVYIDAANPLKVLVLYPDFNCIAVLDNKLSEIAMFRFNASAAGNFYKPLAICREEDGDLMWFYDEFSQKLIGMNEQGEKIYESESFDMLFTEAVVPVKMLFSEQKLYLESSTNQVYLFDRFANFDSTLDPKGKSLQQVFRTTLIFLDAGQISLIDLTSYTPQYRQLNGSQPLQLNIQGDHLFLRSEDAIRVFTN